MAAVAAAAAASSSLVSGARAWNNNLLFSDRERWICVYPAYVNSKKTIAQGRRVPRSKGVDNPLVQEIRDVCAAAGLTIGVENKTYSRESDPRDMKCRGRVRVQLKNDDGSVISEKFATRKLVLEYICETIPRLKTRTQNPSVSGQPQVNASSSGAKKKSKSKKK